jgi:SAM-dependent methyltransferase
MSKVIPQDLDKAAQRGEPSHVWRAGQERRFSMLLEAAGERLQGKVLVDGCGVGTYLSKLVPLSGMAVGLDIELPRVQESLEFTPNVFCAAGENVPLTSDSFDLVFSHEVLEHVQDDQKAISEMVRVLKPGGRIVLFCPNRGYPFETHGHYWKGKYHFGNTPLINWLPRPLRNRLAPHVEVYTRKDLASLFDGLQVKFVERRTIFGAYDNIIERKPRFGKVLRSVLQALEKTPLQRLGLSHFWVVEKI